MTEASDGELERALAPSAAIGTLVPEPPAGEEPDSMLGGGVSPMGDTGPLAAYYSNGAMTVSFPAPKFRIKVPKGRKRPDSFYREVASLFSIAAASGSRPAERIAKANRVPPSTVHRWVKEARRRGVMSPARQIAREQEAE